MLLHHAMNLPKDSIKFSFWGFVKYNIFLAKFPSYVPISAQIEFLDIAFSKKVRPLVREEGTNRANGNKIRQFLTLFIIDFCIRLFLVHSNKLSSMYVALNLVTK